jgi:hypothetical protein
VYRRLPHTLNANAEICVFTKDPQKEWREKFLKAAAPNVEKVRRPNNL